MEQLITVLVVLVLAALGFNVLKKKSRPTVDDSVQEKKRESLKEELKDLNKELEKTDVKKEPIDVEEYWRKQ